MKTLQITLQDDDARRLKELKYRLELKNLNEAVAKAIELAFQTLSSTTHGA